MGLFSKKDPRAFDSEDQFVRAWPKEQLALNDAVNGPQLLELVNDMRGVYRAASEEAKTILLLPTEAHIKGSTKAAKELLGLLDNFHLPGGAMVSANASKFGVKDCVKIVESYLETLRPLALRAASDHEGVTDDKLADVQSIGQDGGGGSLQQDGQQMATGTTS